MYYIKYTFVNTFFRFFRITFLLYKKNIDRLNRGEPTFFLEPNEVKEVKKRCKKDEFNIFKPFIEAEKVILYKDKLPKVVLFKIITKDFLRHQDILGSIFSLNIDKELFGDIIINDNNYYFYLLESMKDYFLTNFNKIKNNYIKLEEIDIDSLKDYKRKYQELELIIKSERIDIVVSNITNTSRSKVKDKFNNKEIILNYEILTNPSYLLKEEDIISIRKYGKFKKKKKIKETKKNNYVIKIHKYI